MTQELLADILRLPSEDRELIVQEILASLDADERAHDRASAAEAWRPELERRAREALSGASMLIDGAEVDADVLSAIRAVGGR